MKVVVVGAGHRGVIYAQFALAHPSKMTVVGVVEPNAEARQVFAATYALNERCCFENFSDFVSVGTHRIADAVIICSPDDCHFSQTIASLDMGYNVLLEKPIAQSLEQCEAIAQKALQTGLVVGVCFPLRYHPVCVRVIEMVEQGQIGQLVMINHTEYIGVARMVHNFVRGNWNTVERSAPLLLTKSCHDLDYIVALAGANCRSVSSYGSLFWFRPENAPTGSADRCVDCAVEASCPYSAIKVYSGTDRYSRYFRNLDRLSLETELAQGPYGRCVYRAGNDVWDNQVLAMQMENGVSVSFSLNAFTAQSKRRTHMMGSMGEIVVDEGFDKIVLRKFLDGSVVEEDFSHLPDDLHAGSDWFIVDNFIEAVSRGDSSGLAIGVSRALESHRIAFAVAPGSV